MTTGWLLLLILLVLSSQSVESQSTTDDNQFCDEAYDRRQMSKLQKDVDKLMSMLSSQQQALQQLQTFVHRLGMQQK